MIYLDNSSTTRPYDQVIEKMKQGMEETYGNPSSLHHMGLIAESALRDVRIKLARSLKVDEKEIVFTGSGTESDNMAMMGAARANHRKGKRILISAVEHPAVLASAERLKVEGFEIVTIGVDSRGVVDLEQLDGALNDQTILVSIMAVNNELGTLQPLARIGDLVKSKSAALFHSDGVQALFKIPLDLDAWQVDLFSVSGHKIHGPKGVGALYIRKGTKIEPLLYGGGQEKGRRGGTENTPGVIGMGAAIDVLQSRDVDATKEVGMLRRYFVSRLKVAIPDCRINSPEAVCGEIAMEEGASSPYILNVSFPGCRGEVLLHALELKNIIVSTGAACSSRKKSHQVLTAIGLPKELAESALRFSFSSSNTMEEMDVVIDALNESVKSMRRLTGRK